MSEITSQTSDWPLTVQVYVYNVDSICLTNSILHHLPPPQLFFEGVEGLIAAGTKAEEVGFRLDYSKTELRKCIKEYPGKEVVPPIKH